MAIYKLMFRATGIQYLSYEADDSAAAFRQYLDGMGSPIESEIEVTDAEFFGVQMPDGRTEFHD